tara:strand:+ start:523 stop:1176 length:654 start_codon:yes stop_codon:yes gene_type:complete
MENIQSNIQGENNMENSNIQQLFQLFIENGGEPKVTAFKRHLDKLINEEIKPLCGRSAKTGLVDDWRSEVKERFGGRGAKWVKVSVEEVIGTAESFEDSADYIGWIREAGFAWIRFAGPRVVNGNKCAAFEVRTGGSTIDHPKQLHYIQVSKLDDVIVPLNSTPHAMKLEVATSPNGKQVEAVEIVIESDKVVEVEENYEDIMGDIEALMAEENMDL